ncbi:hypothetical protein SAMD00019534_000090, partial [Acytostelium subglobosum LB1]|uniref:hypothetical protein n=1 Tax=Acytostelium subglobosum LB1 TaxID=1410327 RepID=UPI000644DE88
NNRYYSTSIASTTISSSSVSGHNLHVSPEKVKVYMSTTNDPLFNIATEDWLFKTFDLNAQTLFLWRNAPTCIIGRHQNPFKECHLQQMEKDGVTLCRRYSGGGAVYQDMGNSIYTFLSPTNQYDKARNSDILIDSLRKFGVRAELSGRNDLVVDGKKVSGAAFKQSGPRSFHHGTMLLDLDLNALQRYLNPNKEKLRSKGITSVISRVCNLKTLVPHITHEQWCQSVMDSFFRCYGKRCDVEELSRSDLQKIPALKEVYDVLSSWEWRYGSTPSFDHQLEHRFDWGTVDINFNCNRGIVESCKIYSDSLNPLMIELLSENLVGIRYNELGVLEALDKVKTILPDTEREIEELKIWLVQQ